MQEYSLRQESFLHSTSLPNAPLQFRKRTTSQTQTQVLSKTFAGTNQNPNNIEENQLSKCTLQSKEDIFSKGFVKVGNHQKLNFQKNKRPKKKI